MYKNQLQEFAQQSSINLPSYSSVREGPDHAPRFKARVSFNGEIFESPKFCFTLRQAEHAAAEVALATLSQRGPSRALAAKVLDETGVYKNLLQETSHRAGMKLPVYTTVRVGPGYAPVFTCTVELGGMTFSGEPAKTKKQAQKSAAMVAWFALKELSLECSSSYHLSYPGKKDEQEQATIARYLSSIKIPETRQMNNGKSERECYSVKRNMIPNCFGRSAYRMQHQQSSYSSLSPETAAYQTWHQGTYQQMSHLLALPSASTSIPRPRIFPVIQSMFRPDIGSLFWAMEKEAAPFTPGIGPVLYLSHELLPLSGRTDSHVTIEEIEKDSNVQEEWLNNNINSAFWKDNLPSTASGISPRGFSTFPQSMNSSSSLDLRLSQKKIGDKINAPNQTKKYSQPEAHQHEEFSWFPSGLWSNRDIVEKEEHSSVQAEHRATWDSVCSSDQWLPYPTPSIPPRPMRVSVAFPGVSCARGRNIGANSSSTYQPKFSNSSFSASTPRTTVVTCTTRPRLEEMKHLRGVPCASQMAPAVQIRSVMPVCSSPARNMPPPNRQGTSSRDKGKAPDETG